MRISRVAARMTVSLPGSTRHRYRYCRIFRLLQKTGGISEHDMFNTFNMGVGMCVIVAPEDADRAMEILRSQGEQVTVIGEVVSRGESEIEIC